MLALRTDPSTCTTARSDVAALTMTAERSWSQPAGTSASVWLPVRPSADAALRACSAQPVEAGSPVAQSELSDRGNPPSLHWCFSMYKTALSAAVASPAMRSASATIA